MEEYKDHIKKNIVLFPCSFGVAPYLREADAEEICKSAQQEALMHIMDLIDKELPEKDIHLVDVRRIICSVHNKLNPK